MIKDSKAEAQQPGLSRRRLVKGAARTAPFVLTLYSGSASAFISAANMVSEAVNPDGTPADKAAINNVGEPLCYEVTGNTTVSPDGTDLYELLEPLDSDPLTGGATECPDGRILVHASSIGSLTNT